MQYKINKMLGGETVSDAHQKNTRVYIFGKVIVFFKACDNAGYCLERGNLIYDMVWEYVLLKLQELNFLGYGESFMQTSDDYKVIPVLSTKRDDIFESKSVTYLVWW